MVPKLLPFRSHVIVAVEGEDIINVDIIRAAYSQGVAQRTAFKTLQKSCRRLAIIARSNFYRGFSAQVSFAMSQNYLRNPKNLYGHSKNRRSIKSSCSRKHSNNKNDQIDNELGIRP